MNENTHVYCPKCGSEVQLADSDGKVITPQAGDFFLRLKDNDPEKAKKIKDVIAAMMGDDVEINDVEVAMPKMTHPIPPAEPADDNSNNEIEQSILDDGDINSRFLWRRWVMSQVLRHYKTADGKDNFHNYFVKNQSMYYVFKTCINEAKYLYSATGIDKEEREMFFNMDVFKAIIVDYLNKYDAKVREQLVELDKINREIVYKKGFEAKRKARFKIGKKEFLLSDAAILKDRINMYRSKTETCESYQGMVVLLRSIVKDFPPFKDCRKPKAWIDAFKGAGAFYTLDNLFRWHNCSIVAEEDGNTYVKDEALRYLRNKAKSLPSEEYYKLYAIMKRVVEENNFDFNKRMKEIHNEVA